MMKMMKKNKALMLAMAIGLPFIFAACLDTSVPTPDYNQDLANELAVVDQTRLTADLAIIDDSLDNEWQVTGVLTEPKGVRYTIETLGTGPKPVLASYIGVNYKGRLLTEGRAGDVFDQSPAGGVGLDLFRLIAGWRTVLPLIPQGSKVTLYIPSGLGYGIIDRKNGSGDIVIPKNSNLIFEIELLSVSGN